PALRAARGAALTVTAPVERMFSGLTRYTSALEENAELRRQTAALAADVARLREARSEADRLRGLVGFGDSLGVARVAARVIGKDITRQANFLTIDRGTADSVEVGMPVVDERGVVGRVILTSAHYAVVMPHQNTQFAIPATIDLLDQDGIVRWDGTGYDRLLMEFVPKTEPVVPGQLVVTSPYSDVFPPGLPVGIVDTAYAAAGRNDYVIYLRPAAPITQARYVYVLLIRPDPEREALEAAAREGPAPRRADTTATPPAAPAE
ncbi:MAG TPA: rod shape-determining protein MreC, partial [Rhodothermales bacterium]|nr:rod shape-determining protein MreC [Rhodothermales bacterium]